MAFDEKRQSMIREITFFLKITSKESTPGDKKQRKTRSWIYMYRYLFIHIF